MLFPSLFWWIILQMDDEPQIMPKFYINHPSMLHCGQKRNEMVDVVGQYALTYSASNKTD